MDFITFLLKAKLKTYSAGGQADQRDLEDGTRELTYHEEDFFYRDRYFGFNPFVGEEVVWQNGKAIWAMNYYGGVTDETVAGQDVYLFLQKAMRQVSAERPFRGPNEYQEGDFVYRDRSEGSVDSFLGGETIHFQGRQVYFLKYHGGKVG